MGTMTKWPVQKHSFKFLFFMTIEIPIYFRNEHFPGSLSKNQCDITLKSTKIPFFLHAYYIVRMKCFNYRANSIHFRRHEYFYLRLHAYVIT